MQEQLNRLRAIGAEIAALVKESGELRQSVYSEAQARGWKVPLKRGDPPFEVLFNGATIVTISMGSDGEPTILFRDVPTLPASRKED